MQIKLYYIFDPLCGWCFGFSPVIKRLEETYKDQISFETLCGGMILGDRIKPLSEMKSYLSEAMPRLEEMTGVKFGNNYLKVLDEGSLMLDSELPSIAMLVYKSMTQKSSVQFASAIQNSLYKSGKDLNKIDTYKYLVEDFGLDWGIFKQKMEDPSYKTKTYDEFKLVGEMGIQGFPSVVLQVDDKAYLIARGYRSFEDMQSVIEELIKKEEIK